MNYNLIYFGQYNMGTLLPLVGYITIIDNTPKKIDVFIGITKLIENISDHESFIYYETNVTNINKLIISNDYIRLDFQNESGETETSSCGLLKHDETPLLIYCSPELEGTSWLKEITTEKIYDDIFFKYNFRIQPVKNNEKIIYQRDNKNTFVYWNYPKTLNFVENDTLIVDYGPYNPDYFNGITFNPEKGDLSCISWPESVRCTVSKSHFEGKKNGYYYTKQNNHLNGKSTNYYIDPIKVILYDSSKTIYLIYLHYSLLLILILL